MEAEMNDLLNAWKICSTGTTKPEQQAAFNYVETFKQTSNNIIPIGFNFILNNHQNALLSHFGLQLISHAVKLRWNNLSIDLKVQIKNNLMEILLNQMNESSLLFKLNYLKNNLCLTFLELVKREWPQNWPSLLTELYDISKKSLVHLDLVLTIYKYMAEEFISNNQALPSSRRKDINQYLNSNMEEIFKFFLDTLNAYRNVSSLAKTTLDCLSYYVDWININIVLSQNGLLIEILFQLLNDTSEDISLASSKCLLALVSRKGALPDRKPLLNLFNENYLNQIFSCIVKSVNSSSRELLRHLVSILVEMGMQLNALWTSTDFQRPPQLQIYLSAIYEFTNHPSKLLSYDAICLWNSLLTNDNIKNDQIILQFMTNLANDLTTSTIIFKVNSKQKLNPYDEDNFDTDEDLVKFITKYRNELAKLIKIASGLCMTSYLAAGLKWASKILVECQVIDDSQGYDTTSFYFLSWDALIFYWGLLMTHIGKSIKSGNQIDGEIKTSLLQLIKLSIDFKSKNPNFTSYNLSLLSSILPVCELDNTELMLKFVLEKLFSEYTFFKTLIENDKVRIKAVLNVRRQCLANILNICRSYTKWIKNLFDLIYAQITQFLTQSESTTVQMEQIILMETLVYCSNELQSYQKQAEFISSQLLSIKNFLLSAELITAIDSVENFILFVGLANHNLPNGLQNRKQIFYAINALFGILKCVQIPDGDETKLVSGGFMDTLTKQVRNPAFPIYSSILEVNLKLLKCFNLLHSQQTSSTFDPNYKDCLQMTENVKNVSLGIQYQQDSKHLEVDSSLYDVDRVQMFIYNTYDTLCQLLGLYFTKFKSELLWVQVNDSNVDFVYKYGDALFSCFDSLPDYRLRSITRYILRGLLESGSPKDHLNSTLYFKMNEILFEYFYSSMLNRISTKNKFYSDLSTDDTRPELTHKQLEDQVIEENQFILLCRDHADLLRQFFSFNTQLGSSISAIPHPDENETPEFIVDVSAKPKHTSTSNLLPMSELAIHLLKANQTIYQSVLLTLFEGLCWSDSFCCGRLVRLAHLLIDSYSISFQNQASTTDNSFCVFLNEQVATQFFTCVLNALQLHGEHLDTSGLLINLASLMYEKFPYPSQDCFDRLLLKIPNLNRKLFEEFQHKTRLSEPKNIEKHKKDKREIFKKLVDPIIGKFIIKKKLFTMNRPNIFNLR